MFEHIMNSPCRNHDFPITHLAKDCVAYQQCVQKQIDEDEYWGDHDDNEGTDAAARFSMLIFGGPKLTRIEGCRS